MRVLNLDITVSKRQQMRARDLILLQDLVDNHLFRKFGVVILSSINVRPKVLQDTE